jgi:homoserine dehydrogenase
MEGLPVRIGLLGCGTVGRALVELITAQSDVIAARTGLRLEVTRIAVRDLARHRERGVPAALLTTDTGVVITDPDIDLVVEVMGGLDPARQLILDTLKAGKPVVSANKELIAMAGPELFAAAEASGVDLLFEAAVAGGIPLVRPLRESLLGEPIRRIMGIVNGTTNYILTRMTEAGASYAEALAEAQALGYAEADPTADVEGGDAGAKIAILASIAFGVQVGSADVYLEGISGLTADDIAFADRKGLVVKLLAIAERAPAPNRSDGDGVAVRVHPVMLARTHPLASVRGSFNAVFIEGTAVGELMLYGRGAGGQPTASAVLGDVIDAAANRRKGGHASVGILGRAAIAPVEDLETEYYVSVDVSDRPGVLAAVAGAFGHHGVSIASMEQEGRGDEARLVFITHVARERDVRSTLDDLHRLDPVRRVGSVIRLLKPGRAPESGPTRGAP